MPARKIPLNYRHITGYIQSDKSDEYTHFEAGLEKDALILCEFNPDIEYFKTQPRRFNYLFNGKHRHYTPDIMVKYKDGSIQYVEVKHRDNLKKDWKELKPRFKAAIKELKTEPNTRFKIWTQKEIRGVYLKNVTFLLPYKKRPFEDYQMATIHKILSRIHESTPKDLIGLCSTSSIEQAEFLNTLWYAVSSGIVKIDLHFPLNMTSPIWIEAGTNSKPVNKKKVTKDVRN